MAGMASSVSCCAIERQQRTWLCDMEAQEAEGSSKGAVWRHTVDRPWQHPQPCVDPGVKHHAAGICVRMCTGVSLHAHAEVRLPTSICKHSSVGAVHAAHLPAQLVRCGVCGAVTGIVHQARVGGPQPLHGHCRERSSAPGSTTLVEGRVAGASFQSSPPQCRTPNLDAGTQSVAPGGGQCQGPPPPAAVLHRQRRACTMVRSALLKRCASLPP
jgi:hypothetical protein